MAPRTVYANLQDGFQFLSTFDQSFADAGSLGVTPCTAAGTNVIALTPAANAFAPSPTLSNNRLYSFIAANTSTGSVTVQLQGLSAVPLYAADGVTQLGANEIVAGTFYVIAANNAGTGAILINGAGGAAVDPFYPVIQPSSGNVQGSGLPVSHQLVWSDANPIFSADTLYVSSTDPSALNSITVTGAPAAGTVTITFKYSSLTIPIVVTVTNGETTTQVAAAIVAAIKANSTLFNAITSTNTSGGGYANSALVGYITNSANVVNYDYNSNVSATIRYSVASAGVTLTFGAGQNSQSVDYALATVLDTNPALQLNRNPGAAPAAGSALLSIVSNSSNSASATAVNTVYGQITNYAVNSTSGAIAGKWFVGTPNVSGQIAQGVYVGAGLYTTTMSDKGNDTIAAKQFWVNSTEEIVVGGGNLELISSGTNGIAFSPASGVALLAQSGVGVEFNIQGDVSQVQVLAFSDSTTRWEQYKPASSTDLRFFDGTADSVVLKTGGEVDIRTGPFSVGLTNTSFSAWTNKGIRYANPAVTYTDTTSTGTVTVAYTDLFGASTINASTTTVYSAYYGSYFQAPVAGTNVTITKGYALGADTFATTSATITGGTIDGSAIGGSTAAAATVTTLVGGTSVLVTGQGGVGYAAGSGGAVTQTSNKATAVTLNKVSGEITMNNAALTAATIVSFTMTNTSIAGTDIIALNHVSGGTPGAYTLNAQAASGGATINVRNNTAGSLSEAIVIGFVVIKGAIT